MFRHRERMQKIFVWVIVVAMVLSLVAGSTAILTAG